MEEYYPGRWDDWEKRKPEDVGMDPKMVEEAISYAKAHETPRPRREYPRYIKLRYTAKRFDDGKVYGKTKPRTSVNGLVLRHGYRVAEWGDTFCTDMTHSVTKSYLSTIAGLALDKGLIRDVHDPVRMYVQSGHFDSPHNAKITWHHLLQQTNEWDGTLWAKHYAAGNPDDELREPQEPGTYYEYNDVRVNLTALALLHVWRRPLPQVLKTAIMDPIDASNTWRWYGYRNSWVTIDGLRVQSVSGGGHWGGGLQISTRDHARFGYLFLRQGRWRTKELVSKNWVSMATTPCVHNPAYGYMWWLNSDRQRLPSAPVTSYFASGEGGNRIWVDPEHDLVVVIRWMDVSYIDGVIKRLLTNIQPSAELES
ncbi:MAG: serine hydrolase [Candidatus Bathyarchaeota archaeon]|nr:serine hydrolase [Candidatus Bathyarchaeota archaeon]